MNQELNPCDKKQTKVELQILPCVNEVKKGKECVEVKNHENQDDSLFGKIILAITFDGSKLTKADAGYASETTEEIWASVKLTKADAGRVPDIVVDVHEKCGAKLTKAGAGLA
jgi:hypothetical protein